MAVPCGLRRNRTACPPSRTPSACPARKAAGSFHKSHFITSFYIILQNPAAGGTAFYPSFADDCAIASRWLTPCLVLNGRPENPGPTGPQERISLSHQQIPGERVRLCERVCVREKSVGPSWAGSAGKNTPARLYHPAPLSQQKKRTLWQTAAPQANLRIPSASSGHGGPSEDR